MFFFSSLVHFGGFRWVWPQSYGHHWNQLIKTLLLAPWKVKSEQQLLRCLCPNKKSLENSQIVFLVPISTTRRVSDPKVIGTIESGSLRCFIWPLAKSNQKNCYGDINYQENSRAGAAVTAAGGAATGVQYNSKVLMRPPYIICIIFFKKN